jgi:hypothetical protein
MPRNQRISIAVVITLTALGAANQARAQSCQTLIGPIIADRGGASIKIATNRDDNRWVSYSQARLNFRPASFLGGTVLPARLVGDATQLFSDRFVSWEGFSGVQPFNEHAADLLRVTLFGDGRAVIHNLTWGGSISFQGTCIGQLLYGYVDGQMYVISLTPIPYQPPPR